MRQELEMVKTRLKCNRFKTRYRAIVRDSKATESPCNFFPNFAMIMADNGHALLVDFGLFNEAFLDRAIQGMRERLRLKQIDAVLISHMHGDHFLEAPHLREKWGAQIWALDRLVDQVERTEHSSSGRARQKLSEQAAGARDRAPGFIGNRASAARFAG